MVGNNKFKRTRGPVRHKGEGRKGYMLAQAKRHKFARSPGITVGFWNVRNLVPLEKKTFLR